MPNFIDYFGENNQFSGQDLFKTQHEGAISPVSGRSQTTLTKSGWKVVRQKFNI